MLALKHVSHLHSCQILQKYWPVFTTNLFLSRSGTVAQLCLQCFCRNVCVCVRLRRWVMLSETFAFLSLIGIDDKATKSPQRKCVDSGRKGTNGDFNNHLFSLLDVPVNCVTVPRTIPNINSKAHTYICFNVFL